MIQLEDEKYEKEHATEKAKARKAAEKKARELLAAKAEMGGFKYYACPWLRNRYIVEEDEVEDEEEELTPEELQRRLEAKIKADELERKEQVSLLL